MPLLHRFRFLAPLAILCLLSAPLGQAEAPAPVASFVGDFRGFSPDGSYGVAWTSDGVILLDARTWKPLGSYPLPLPKAPQALLVDNLRRVAILQRSPEGKRVLDVVEFRGEPRRLIHEVGVTHRAISLEPDGEIHLMGVSSYFTDRSVVIRSSKGIILEQDNYQTTAYTCTIAQYLTNLAGLVDRNLTAASAPAVRKACDVHYEFPSSVNAAAWFSLSQTDFGIWWSASYTYNGSHPATGVKDDEERSKEGRIRFPGLEAYRFSTEGADAELTRIATADFQLLSGRPWRVSPKGGPAFDLVQLEAPTFTPKRISADGRFVVFGDGQRTRVYAASLVTDSYANLDAEVMEDIVMGKIEAHLRKEQYEEALPYFDRLARSGRPLPESFYFYEIDTLEHSGRKTEARAKAEAYLRKHGKKGKYYAKVIAVMTRI
ncbi:MAG: tetratricopeptide repeat protein [Acidobacteria bacterium]|nr:tetratricopeptide repeat protein [Acidobacteriota bacterium]